MRGGQIATSALLLATSVYGRACAHADARNGTHFVLDGCTSLDLSCPSEGTRVPGCDNLLAPQEIADLARALGDGDAVTTLEAVDFRGSPLGAAGAAALAPRLGACTKLHTLGLGSTRIGEAGLRHIMNAVLLAKGSMVTSLDLTHNSIGDDGVRALFTGLKSSKESTRLAKLDLSWNGIGTRGGRYLADGLKDSAVASLSELRVSWNGLADRGARAIGEALASNSALTLLDLQYNAIKDEGARAFAKGLRANAALKTLQLENNGVTRAVLQETLDALAAVPSRSDSAGGGSGGGGGGGSAPRSGAAVDDEEEVEEMAWEDDDMEEMAEKEAERAAEVREQEERAAEAAAREAAAAAKFNGPCVDDGPWACLENGCPSDPLGCSGLAELGLCANTFGAVWEVSPPEGLEAVTISSRCPIACGLCIPGKDEV